MTTKHDDIWDEAVDYHSGRDKMRHFGCPEGYPEGLTEAILASVKEHSREQEQAIQPTTWWTKLKPSLYLAASFVGLFLAFKGLNALKDTLYAPSVDVAIQSDETYESYYEDYSARLWEQDWVEVADEDIALSMLE